ncbi:hypothetical protein EZV62_011010 [Acer yangbiense]|uniref:non-specific serine/threonine protein kinase n=1 Tax=Acer yangbiense TaxID=1000413 RepID=A0A5C7I695_9ROSI|nr:hypothetical protein EZV62_011010 [Acer yangbiense]
MKFYTSCVDTGNRNINFITEMFTSGTLKQYRLKQKRVNIRALERWSVGGKKPNDLYKVKDPEVWQFVEKCLATVSLRLSTMEMLNDPFLQIKDAQSELRPPDYWELDGMGPLIRQPYLELYAVKRKAVDIWGCKDCGKVKTGGAYTLNTASAVTVRSTIRSLSEKTES